MSDALVIGQFTSEQSEALRMALSRAGMKQRAVKNQEAAERAMSREAPGVILVDAATVDPEPLVKGVRARGELFGALIVAIVPSANDGAFREAVELGCDDVIVAGDLGAVTRRAAVLVNYDATTRPVADQGVALVAHPDDHQRRIIGRTLRLAGFDVRFAKHGSEVAELVKPGEVPELLVTAESLQPSGAVRAVIDVRQSGVTVPSVIVGSPRELRELGDELLKRTATLRENSPPDHLLFVTNELLRPGVQDLRASRRVLFDSMCAFRPAGQLHPVLGLTYNISAQGLYVRTLDPPPRGSTLWFELRPPHSREAVHLRGTVVWVKPMGTGPGGSAPAGFGVRIEESLCPPADLARYHECYESLVVTPRMVA